MRRSISTGILVILSLFILSAPGCSRAVSSVNGSGKVIDQEIEVADFDSINAQGEFILDIVQSDTVSVILSTDDNLMSRIKLVRERKTLKISIEAPANFFPTSLKIKIFMPQITGINLSGGAKATVSGFKSDEVFSLFLADKGNLKGSLEAGEVNLHLSDASTLALTGSAAELNLTALKDSKLDLKDFSLKQASVKLEEASEAIVNINGRIDLELRGKSKVFFLGNPVFTNTFIADGSTVSMIQQ
jgi:hypothetical protein